jgi:hypothetical protein
MDPKLLHTLDVYTFQDKSDAKDLFILTKPNEGQAQDMTPERVSISK